MKRANIKIWNAHILLDLHRHKGRIIYTNVIENIKNEHRFVSLFGKKVLFSVQINTAITIQR